MSNVEIDGETETIPRDTLCVNVNLTCHFSPIIACICWMKCIGKYDKEGRIFIERVSSVFTSCLCVCVFVCVSVRGLQTTLFDIGN